MARDLRYIPSGSLVAITNRAFQERLLLLPSPGLSEIIHGAIGRAQRKYGVRIVHYVFLSNHYHLLAIAEDAQQLSSFVGYFQAKIAREAGRLHGWSGRLWARRYRAIVVSHEPEVQVARLDYLLSQGCKEGFVWSPKHWPGASATKALLSGREIDGLWFDRTREHQVRQQGKSFSKLEFAEKEVVALTPLPCWQDESPDRMRTKARARVRAIEEEVDERVRQGGRPPMGVRAILAQDPLSRPARSKRSPAPRFHARSGPVRRALERGYRRFYWDYRHAAQRLREGLVDAVFPPGSFPPPARFVAPLPASGFR